MSATKTWYDVEIVGQIRGRNISSGISMRRMNRI